MIFNAKLTHKSMVFVLFVGLLVFGLAAGVTGQEEVWTGSESIGYENVGKVMSEVAGADVDNKEQVTEALENLFGALADHLEEKGVPDHLVEKFEDRAESLTSMGRAGLLNKEQLSSEASNITKNALRDEEDGEVPVSVMEKAGMSEEEVEELSGKGQKEKEAAETVRKMARGREKEREEVQEKEKTGEDVQEKSRERDKEQESKEKEEKEDEKADKEEPGNQGNGKGKDSAGTESKDDHGNGRKSDNPGKGNKGGPSDPDEEEDEEPGNSGKSKGKGN